MRKAQRVSYLGLTTICLKTRGTASLCSFCRYAEWYGSCGDEAELDCKHPLEILSENAERVWEGDGRDCWGFLPKMKIEVAADIVGIWLRGEEPNWATVPLLSKGERVKSGGG